jgi:hypothetical protein
LTVLGTSPILGAHDPVIARRSRIVKYDEARTRDGGPVEPMLCSICGLTFPFLGGRCESCGHRPGTPRVAVAAVAASRKLAATGTVLFALF